MLQCDVLVIGAGPAGASAAAEAARGGAHTLLIEKNKRPGLPVRCAEFIPRLLINMVSVSRSCIARELKGMKSFLPGGECISSHLPGFMLFREIFDRELVIGAVKEGAELLVNTKCIAREENRIIAKKRGGRLEICAKVVIGADGPRSIAGKWINSVNSEFLIGLQYELPLQSQLEYTEVYFRNDLFGGYGWLFPKEKTANVGVGIKYAGKSGACSGKLGNPESEGPGQIRKRLDELAGRLVEEGKVSCTVIGETSGLIPAGGPLPKTTVGNIMLVGDAAGQTHPVTGGGIPQAIVCGKIAGRIAALAVKNSDYAILEEYDQRWRALYLNELERGRERRKLIESQWHDLESIIKRCWVIFREYYR